MLRDISGTRLEKFCNKCKEWKSLESFDHDRSRGDNRAPNCKACRKERRVGGNHD